MQTAATPQNVSRPFAMRGDDNLAYVRSVRSEEVGFLSADAPLLPPGRMVFVLLGPDGSPLVIAESLESIVAEAQSHDLQTVSLQ
jgi:hypothetical protein